MPSADDKCGTVVHGNYYAESNKETKAILQGIQAQLSEMQEQLREIKICNSNKTGKRKKKLKASPSQGEYLFNQFFLS